MLIQLSTLAQRLGLSGAEDADSLTWAIRQAGGLFEAYLNRKLARLEDDTFTIRANHRELLLPRYPVEEISKIELKFEASTVWHEEIECVPMVDGATGIVDLGTVLGNMHELLRLTYTGGFVLPGDTVPTGATALPLEIQGAALDQAAFLYENRNALRQVNLPSASKATRQAVELGLLESVRDQIAPFRRILM